MPENFPAKSYCNSKWVIRAWVEAKGVFGFYLKMSRKLTKLKLQNKIIRVEDVHPQHVCQSVKGVTRGIVINLRKTVYINVYLHVNLTLLKIKTENKYNNHCCHVPIHFPYLSCQFSVASSPSFFLRQFCGLIS